MDYSLSLSTLIALGANIFLAIVAPILLYIFVGKRHQCSGRVFFAGISTMIAFGVLVQMLINVFFLPTAAGQFIYERPVLFALFMGLVAALIHEPGRYLCVKYFVGEELWDDHNALMFGVGYGSAAMLVSMLTSSLGNFLMAQMIITGQANNYLQELPAEEMAAAMDSLETLCNTPLNDYLMIIVEPFIKTVAHTALSVMVWYAVQGGKKAVNYLLMAMGLGFVLEFAMAMVGSYVAEATSVQILYAVLTAGVAYVAVRVWKKEFKPVNIEE